jgi:hypothetical protein
MQCATYRVCLQELAAFEADLHAHVPPREQHPLSQGGGTGVRSAVMKRLWIGFILVVVASFSVLGWVGVRVYQQAPPVPERVVTADGRMVLGPGDIERGRDVWRSLGGMEMGSIWGHGSYVAPDWDRRLPAPRGNAGARSMEPAAVRGRL